MSYPTLFATFFLIGAVTFGGGYAMLPMICEQVALKWSNLIPQEDLINFVAISESTPGPFAINMATYVGATVGMQGGSFAHSAFGAICATFGVVLPSFIVILIVAKCYDRFRSSTVVRGCMSGLKPAVVGLIASAVLSVVFTVFFPAGIGLSVLTSTSFYVNLGIFALMLVLAFRKVHPIAIICLSAGIGIGVGYLGL